MRKVFLEFDLAGAEWTLVAYLAQDPRMIEVAEGSMSPHVATAHFATGVPPDLILKEEELLEGCIDPKEIERVRRAAYPEVFDVSAFLPSSRTLRDTFKKANHSLNYGLGYKTFALRAEITEVEAKAIHKLYHTEAYPGVQGTFHAFVKRSLRREGCLVNCFGQRRDFLSEPGPEVFLDAYAHLPQSTVMEITRRAMVHVYREEPEAELISQDHDAITVQVPPLAECIAGVVSRIKKVLACSLTYGGRTFVLRSDAKMGISRSKRDMVKVSGDAAQVTDALERVMRNGPASP